MPSVSIIIATASRPDALAATLRSLSGVRIPEGWCVELVLVENVAQTGAEALLSELPPGTLSTRYFFEPVRGKSRALNLAISRASGDVFLFSDDDVRFPSDWLERMCEPIFAGRADGVAGGARLAPHLLRPWMNHTHRAWLASTADYLSPDDPSEMCGANMAVRRQVFDRVGLFDPELGPGITGGGEESLLSWKMKAAGLRYLGALHVEIEHHPSADRLLYASWIKAAQLKGQSTAYLMHHWHARSVRFPRLFGLYLRAKLLVRRALTGRRKPGDEGIAPWELSYVEGIAMMSRYVRERRRPRNHNREQLTQSNFGPPGATV